MKKLIYFAVISLALSAATAVSAAMDPELKGCIQRGYTLETAVDGSGTYCVFPNQSKCLLTDFNAGKCGAQFMTVNYCVKEGGFVWDKEKCCPGTSAYIKRGYIGQPICKQMSFWQRLWNKLFAR